MMRASGRISSARLYGAALHKGSQMGQAEIGSLRVNLGLDSANFEKGARRLSSPLQKMRKNFLAVTAVATAMGASITAAALAGAKEIDGIAKSARRLDSSIGGFRALQLSASEAGVSLAGLTNDIQTMNRELASIGVSGNGARALDVLGLSIDDLEGKDADEKLATIADQVVKLGLSSGQTTAILRDLGVRNREMALLVLQGGAAIRQARKDIHEYGLEISAIDASKIEKANDQIGRLGLISQYAGQQLALSIVPALGDLAQAMTDSLKNGGALRSVLDGLVGNLDRLAIYVTTAATAFGVRYVAALALSKLATFTFAGALVSLRRALLLSGVGVLIIGAGELALRFGRLIEVTGGWGKSLGFLGDVAAGVWEGIATSAQSLAPALGAIWQNIRASFLGMLEILTSRWSMFLGSLAGGIRDVPGLGAAYEMLNNAAGNAVGSMNKFNAESVRAATNSAALNKEASDLAANGWTKAKEALRSLGDAVSDANSATVEQFEATDALSGVVSELADVSEGAAKSTKELSKEQKTLAGDLNGKVTSAVKGVAGAWGDFTVNGFRDFKGFTRSVLGVFKSMLSQMIALAASNKITVALGLGGAVSAAGVNGVVSSAGSAGLLGSLGGGTGFLGGVGNVIGGLASGGFSGGLSAIGSAVGGATAGLGGFAAAVGAIAVPLLAVAAVFSFFKKKTKLLDAGLRITTQEMGTFTQSFTKIQTKRFWGLSKKTRVKFSNAGAGISDPIQDAVFGLQTNILSAADALGIGADAFSGFSHSVKISTKGMSGEQAGKTVENAIIGVGNAFAGMIPGLAEVTLAGETSTKALERLTTRLALVNGTMDLLSLKLFDIGLTGAAAASSFVDLFGSLDGFATAASSYYQSFFSDAERAANGMAVLSLELAALGIDALPSTRAAFRALVDEANSLGDDALTASLIKLAPVFAEITARSNALNDSLSKGNLFRTLQDSVYANTAAGYQQNISSIAASDSMAVLLKEVIRAVRDGDINNARLTQKLVNIQQRAELEPSL